MKKIKFIGYLVFSLIWIFTAILVSLLIIEFTNGFAVFKKKSDGFELHKTKYYGNELEQHPYKEFDVKYLHPYLIWSMPWQKKDISKINNEFISIDKYGQRINPYQNNKTDYAILLGGSTAFGYYSSSNKKSPAALLTKNSNYSFINLNGPSWNSHQELIALIKYEKQYKLSLSLSGTNDISIFCHYTRGTELEDFYPDSIERFEDLNNVLNNIVQQLLTIDSLTLIKHFIVKIFPHSTKLYIKFKNNTEDNNKNLPTQTATKSKCLKEDKILYNKVNIIVDKFLKNQNMMRIISESRNAKHYLFLQPRWDFNTNIDSKKKELYVYAYNRIINSNFCKNNCFNLGSIYKDLNYDTKSYMNNFSKKYNSEIFIDSIHLSDRGVEIIAPIILEKLN